MPGKSCAMENERRAGRSRKELCLKSLEIHWVPDSEWAVGQGENGVHALPRLQSLRIHLSLLLKTGVDGSDLHSGDS